MRSTIALLALAGIGRAVVVEKRQATTTASLPVESDPSIFAVTPEILEGPTSTGSAPYLAETNPAPFPSKSYIANTPLETAIPIIGNVNNSNIFQLMGQVSHYFPNPTGFGADEFALPAGANITQAHMLSRHGSRYPTSGSGQAKFGAKVANVTAAGVKFTGALSFLNTWKYTLGYEILVPIGNQELFDSGVLHYYNYGHLYKSNTTIVARTTTQSRMRRSGEYFLDGFFGRGWETEYNAKLEFIIEQQGFNNTLAGYFNCNNSNAFVSTAGTNASNIWIAKYLQNATQRFKDASGGYNWTASDVYAAQGLCPYETVAFGYSAFCDLFTYQEWEGFEYSIDLSFAGNNMFGSPTGRAVGVGYVEELIARLEGQRLTTHDSQANITLDENPLTSPLNQSLFFDFSHDTNIAAILTALGLVQFAPTLPTDHIDTGRSLIVSHMEPFGARLDIEVIQAPHPVAVNRTCSESVYTKGGPTKYVHFILNQRTVPLGRSLPACGNRSDGWCELETFLEIEKAQVPLARYNYACNGQYGAVPYGGITTGAPL